MKNSVRKSRWTRPGATGFARWAGLSAVILATLAMAACATAPTPKTDPVVQRAEARWAALFADDLEKAYSFYSPGYRSTTSLVDFGVSLRLRKVTWTGATYQRHQCDGDRCTVDFLVDYRVRKPVPGLDEFNGKSEEHETWVRTAGEWWYVPNK